MGAKKTIGAKQVPKYIGDAHGIGLLNGSTAIPSSALALTATIS